MAKPFYSMDEACQKLGKDADGIKALVRDGKLREFRDAGKVFFKADDVDKLSGKGPAKADSGEIVLESGDDEIPSLADVGGGTSMIGLAPTDEDDNKSKKEGTVISSAGIDVFDDELEIDADPMAKTQITESATGDQVSLEGTGGGSGLLDLTREADDTSLGAELLDEIYPGEEDAAPKPAAKAPTAREVEAAPAAEPEPVAVAYAPTGDPTESVFDGLMVGSLLMLALAGSVGAAALQGFAPGYAQYLSNNLLVFLAVALGVPLVSVGIGWVMGRASSSPRRG